MDRCQYTRRQDQFRFALVCYALTLLGSSVTVAEERSSFTWIIQPKGGLVLSGSTFKFNCSAMYFNKHVYYYWKFNDTDIKVNDSSSQFTMRNISNGVQLVIKNVTLKNQGKYECFAKPTGDNTTFNGSAAMLEVKVVETPTGTDEPSNLTWIRHPASQTVDKGSSVTFTCLADCDKLISYHWIANNKTIGENAQPRYKIKENGTLEIARTTEDDKGIYQCFVTTKDGRQKLGESFTAELDVKDQTKEVKVLGSIWKTAGIAVGCAAGYILLMVLLMLYLEHRKTKKEKRRESVAFIGRENLAVETDVEDGNATGSNCVAMNPVFRADPTSEKSQFEFPKHDLVEIMNLGYGAYGHAFLARASGIQDNKEDSMVVVKSLRSEEDRVQREFKEEMKALCGLQHTNVVSLLGVCTLEEPAYIIFELVEKGDLKQYLMSCSHDGRSKLDTNKKQAICSQVLSGMNYLSSKKFVHKDLAARNCMIDRDLNVKIGFLRLSCDVYSAEYCRFNNMQIPLRWMPPEAIFTGKFSEKSDVWSYGVLTWEIFTCGQMPYRDCSNEEALKCIKGDLRLPKPDDCPDTVLEVLQKCWERNPLDRPTFQELSDTSLL